MMLVCTLLIHHVEVCHHKYLQFPLSNVIYMHLISHTNYIITRAGQNATVTVLKNLSHYYAPNPVNT